MRNRAFLTLILGLLLCSTSVNGQQRTNQSLYVAKNHFEEVFAKENFKDVNYAYIEGSAYLVEDYQNAEIMYNGKKLGEYPIKFNAFLDQMETPNEKGGIGAIKKAENIAIKMSDDVFQVSNYITEDGTVEKGYFITITEGSKCNLYLRKYKTLKEAEEAKTSFHQSSATKFLDHQDYYLNFGDNNLKKVKLKRNKVLNSFSTHTDEIKDFAKKQKLDLASENGIIELVKYYNTIDKASS